MQQQETPGQYFPSLHDERTEISYFPFFVCARALAATDFEALL